MITAVHTLVYAEDPEAARAFFRDILELPSADTGGGWLIFKSGPSELGVHPRSWEYEGQTSSTEQRFDVSLMCDERTRAELSAKGGRVHRLHPRRRLGSHRSAEGAGCRRDDALPAEVRPAGHGANDRPRDLSGREPCSRDRTVSRILGFSDSRSTGP